MVLGLAVVVLLALDGLLRWCGTRQPAVHLRRLVQLHRRRARRLRTLFDRADSLLKCKCVIYDLLHLSDVVLRRYRLNLATVLLKPRRHVNDVLSVRIIHLLISDDRLA